MPKLAINNSKNMKMIRKRMVDLDLDSIEELAEYLYTSDTTLRGKLNGRTKMRITDVEYIEARLEIKFDWNEIKILDKRWCLFYERKEVKENDETRTN